MEWKTNDDFRIGAGLTVGSTHISDTPADGEIIAEKFHAEVATGTYTTSAAGNINLTTQLDVPQDSMIISITSTNSSRPQYGCFPYKNYNGDWWVRIIDCSTATWTPITGISVHLSVKYINITT